MEILTNNEPNRMIVNSNQVTSNSTSFIEANTKEVTLEHLKRDCIIPVFAKDNESTISHYQFINRTMEVVKELFPDTEPKLPEIRVSHVIKGRIPSAIGKPAKELKDFEKTIYYERCAFLIEIPSVKEVVNGSELTLSIGGVRAYNQENLYSRKSLEKFKLFIGFKNLVCTNMCVSTDGFSNQIRISSISELDRSIDALINSYDIDRHKGMMERMNAFKLSEQQFAHLVGKLRMYQYQVKQNQRDVFHILFKDSHINHLVKDYYNCPNFKRESDGSINLWNLYNILTEANKTSYIDSNLERNVNAYELINMLGDSLQNNESNWFINK
ncbi:DUF3871 family protein [Hanstruepera marina]|uniref:DUF3871 family protein n=1 Tax=Hanstruepera marina TaxID=2873265 RepID=UPI001CA63D04|nr:DUF3871 family protein [Hanstruepera marina]